MATEKWHEARLQFSLPPRYRFENNWAEVADFVAARTTAVSGEVTQ